MLKDSKNKENGAVLKDGEMVPERLSFRPQGSHQSIQMNADRQPGYLVSSLRSESDTVNKPARGRRLVSSRQLASCL